MVCCLAHILLSGQGKVQRAAFNIGRSRPYIPETNWVTRELQLLLKAGVEEVIMQVMEQLA